MAVAPLSRLLRNEVIVASEPQIDPVRVVVWLALLGMVCLNLLALGYGVVFLCGLLV
jgi:hypothetical protein